MVSLMTFYRLWLQATKQKKPLINREIRGSIMIDAPAESLVFILGYVTVNSGKEQSILMGG